MKTLPAHMTSRWQHRDEPEPGEGTVYWHMLMRDCPPADSLARQAQQRLSHFSGLHMTPLRWLHATTMIAGPAADFTEDQLARMAEAASELLAHMSPVTVALGRILYHPEAIMLGMTPAQALAPIRQAARAATQKVMNCQSPDDTPCWTPHITICYSTSDQPAAPIIAALGHQLPSCNIQIDALSLVIQHGPERRWDWSTAATIHLAAKASA